MRTTAELELLEQIYTEMQELKRRMENNQERRIGRQEFAHMLNIEVHGDIRHLETLLRAMHKRLEELQSQVATVQQEPPSLMVQIQNAPDLTTLDALEIDVSTRHPDIQPRLMGYVKKRRFELEQTTEANDEALP